jgi:hypothetical protein
MLILGETLRTFPNLGRPLLAASEQTRTNQKKTEWKKERGPDCSSSPSRLESRDGGGKSQLKQQEKRGRPWKR